MKNIVILSPFFYPELISTGKYNGILAKELSQNADSIDVICGHPMYPQWEVEPTNRQLEGITAIRGGKWLKFPKNVLLRRAVLEIWYCFYVLIKLLFSSKKYSHVVPVFPPSLFMLLVPLLNKKAKVIGIVHDLQGVYANRNAGVIKRGIFGLIKWVEKKAFKSCDKLIFLSEDMENVASSQYSLERNKNFIHYPFITIEQFFDEGNLAQIIPNDQKSLVYSGALGEKQAPEELARMMEAVIAKDNSVRAYIFSQGPEFENLKKQFNRIEFHPLVDERDLPELLLRSTIQVLPQAEGTSDGSLPSKLPNLLASGCKIFCITDQGSELVRLLNDYSKAIVNHKWDIDSLANECLQLLNLNTNEGADSKLLSKFYISSLVDRIIK